MQARLFSAWLLAVGVAGAQPQCIPPTTVAYYQRTDAAQSMRKWWGSGDSSGDLVVLAIDDAVWSRLYAFRGDNAQLLWQKPLLGEPSQVAVSNDGKWLAIAARTTFCRAAKIQLWNARTGEELPKLSGQVDEQGYSVAFSNDSRLLAGSMNGQIAVWDVPDGKPRAQIEPPGFDTRAGIEKILDLGFDRRLPRVTGRNQEGMQYTWDWHTGELISKQRQHQESASGSGNDKASQFWTAADGGVWKLSGKAASPANQPLTIEFIDFNDGQVKRTFTIPPREK